MKASFQSLSFFLLSTILLVSCQKEISFEGGDTRPSSGSLQANAGGACLGSVVSGTYKKDTSLNAGHYVDVNVQVDTVGSYTITTDTVNGYSFKATGTFTVTGLQQVRLAGTGKPLAAGNNIFTVIYDGTTCDFTVSVTASGGTGGTAVFTSNCNAVFAGTYQAGTPLTAANTVTLNVNVTTVGSWSVTSNTVNGVSFSGSGNFTTTGAQTITLTGSGTPTASGTFNYQANVGSSVCTLTCTFSPAPVNDYFPRTNFSNWSYQLDGVASDSILVRATAATLTVAGNPFTIFQETDDLSAGWDSSGYYRRAGGNYYEWIDIGTSVGLDDPYWIEYIFLKDDVPVNTTWDGPQFTGTVNSGAVTVTARFGYKILQKDVNATSVGTSYPNTIIVEERLYQFNGTTWVDLTTQPNGIALRYYYSRNVGLIKVEAYDQGVTLSAQLEMRRFHVY